MIKEVTDIQSQTAKEEIKKAKTTEVKPTPAPKPEEVPAEKKPTEAPPVVLKVE